MSENIDHEIRSGSIVGEQSIRSSENQAIKLAIFDTIESVAAEFDIPVETGRLRSRMIQELQNYANRFQKNTNNVFNLRGITAYSHIHIDALELERFMTNRYNQHLITRLREQGFDVS